MSDDKKKNVENGEAGPKEEEPKGAASDVEAPVNAICEGAAANAAAQVDDESEIKPVEGFFLTSQRWH